MTLRLPPFVLEKKRELVTGGVALLCALGLSLAFFLPSLRGKLALEKFQLVHSSAGSQVEQKDQEGQLQTLVQVQERVDQLEKGMSDQRQFATEQRATLLSLQDQLRSAADEAAKTNAQLLQQQGEWLSLAKRGVGTPLPASSSAPATAANGEEKTSQTSKLININTATEAELDSLPGIGPSYAARIIAYRTEKGKFKQVEDLLEVTGIGEAILDKIRDLIEV